YVAEYGGMKITLLRPDTSKLVYDPRVNPDQQALVFAEVKAGNTSDPATLLLKNQGKHTLSISSLVLTGDEPSLFKIVQRPTLPAGVVAGATVAIAISFQPTSSTAAGIHTATLRIKSNDPLHPSYNIPLRGFAMNGVDGANEPSLQRLLDLYQIP